MRKIGAALLFMVAGAFLLLAGFALENLWEKYQDSPDSTYIEVAAIEAAFALGFAGVGAWMLRGR